MTDTKSSGLVRIENAVVYGSGGGRPLRCDVYYPPDASSEPGAKRPCVMLIHGGAWSQGDRSQLKGYGIRLAKQGYVCAAIEYRLSGEAKWPAQLHDVKAGLRYLRSHSSELGIDATKICVSGNSAGAHLALMLAATQNVAELEGDGGNPRAGTECAACVAFYAPTKLFGTGAPSNYAPGLFTDGSDVQVARAASPIEYARESFPPTLLIHGNRDRIVRPSASLDMYQALAAAGAPVELHMYNGAPHGFDASREFGRQCSELMLLFLDRHVVNPRSIELAFAAQARTAG
jgi:acetyl esterase/lipase